MENINGKIIQIEDINGNIIMALEIDMNGNIVQMLNCNVADIDIDYNFNTNKPCIRLQAEEEYV